MSKWSISDCGTLARSSWGVWVVPRSASGVVREPGPAITTLNPRAWPLVKIAVARETRASEAREVSVPLSDGATIAWLYRHGDVRSRRDDGEMALLTVALDAAATAQFERRLAR